MAGIADFLMGAGPLKKAAGSVESGSPKATPQVDTGALLKRNEAYAKDRVAKSAEKARSKAITAPKQTPAPKAAAGRKTY